MRACRDGGRVQSVQRRRHLRGRGARAGNWRCPVEVHDAKHVGMPLGRRSRSDSLENMDAASQLIEAERGVSSVGLACSVAVLAIGAALVIQQS